jgi:protein SCO1
MIYKQNMMLKLKTMPLVFAFCLLAIPLSILWVSCGDEVKTLPIIGEQLGVTASGDTLYPTIPNFSFINQNGDTVTNADFEGKIYVVDFFFTHCPTICPKVTAQMLRVHDRFKDSTTVLLLSHSIDPKHDTIGRLKEYATKLGVVAPKWQFVTGIRDSIYGIADDYFSIAKENPNMPGGFDHSGRLILVDKKRHVRSFCDGTNAKDVDRFINDVQILLQEK